MELWELVAREQIRDTLARYNWSGDGGRLDSLTETFCTDGILEIRGVKELRGRAEIGAFLGSVTADVAKTTRAADVPDEPVKPVKPIVRHNLTNVMFTELSRHRAGVSSYFTVVTHIGLDHCGRYRDILVPVGDGWLIRHRKVSTDWAAAESAMASTK